MKKTLLLILFILLPIQLFAFSIGGGMPSTINKDITINGELTATTINGTVVGVTTTANFSSAPWVTSVNDIYYNVGNVGIGTANPSESLHVIGSVNINGDLDIVSTADGIVIISDSDDNLLIAFNTAGNSYVNTGNFGIGTDTPLARLHVNGSIIKKVTESSGNYAPSLLTNDYIIAFTDTTATRDCTISNEDVASGSISNIRIFVIKDKDGNAATGNITITLENGGTIDGQSSLVISGAYNSATIGLDGTNAFVY